MMRVLIVVLLVLIGVPDWSGEARLPLHRAHVRVTVGRVGLDPRDPGADRVGALRLLDGWHFSADDPAFGGYSAMAVAGERFLLLSDGGETFRFTLGADGVPRDERFGSLPAGPGSGWRKLDRDSESLAREPTTGRLWVGFEQWNAVWRYAPGFARAEASARPAAMRGWPHNGGAEAMARLADGSFVVLSEKQKAGPGRAALLFDRDPTDRAARVTRFVYRPPDRYVATDIAALPDGRWLVLNRRVTLLTGFTTKLVLVDPRLVRPGAVLGGRELATLASPLIHDNFEGLAITREHGRTIVWMVSDDNNATPFQRTLLLKFALDLPPA